MVLRMLGLLAAGYAVVVALMFFGQSSLVHLPNVPSRTLVATPERIDLDYEGVNFAAADGTRLHGWYVPAPEADRTLLFLHGNAGNISHRLDSLRIFHDLGLNVFIIDYRGYGQSEGRPSEAGLHADALAALDYLEREHGVPTAEVVAFGRSLGGAVAACLATRKPLAALILESTFISVPELGSELYPWLPVRWLSRLEYDALACLEDVAGQEDVGRRVPTLIVHSREDDIVPFRHGQALAAAGGAELLELRGDHNRGFLVSGEQYTRGLARFLSDLPAVNTAGDEADDGDTRASQ
ncbi:MAG: alpha/beta hydrolase [Gammaproteobacteria bacterium]|nr:alpha/beta hydrolase [Gammaproteobacteria bacterium]